MAFKIAAKHIFNKQLNGQRELITTHIPTVNAELLGPVIASYCKTVVDLVPAVDNRTSLCLK